MCGLAGIVGALTDANRAALERMERALVHRGPDDRGTWESAADGNGWGVLMAHRRLAILDLSPAGAQPMVDPSTGDTLAFNGEIYNFGELRDTMTASGPFTSTGDTEVMLRLLSRRGLEAAGSMRGMFAAAFYDAGRRQLALLRDPLGIKPLYVTRNRDPSGAWSVAWASEVRALVRSGLLADVRLDPAAVSSMMWNGFVVGPATAVRGISEVMPGTVTLFDRRGSLLSTDRFWQISAGQGTGLPDDEMASALEESVRLHLASDVPLAVFLSSGVDSASVANLARRASDTPIHTFTLAFDDPEHNEGPEARRIATALGAVHHEVVLTESEVVDRLDAALGCLDQPSFDGVNSYFMSHAVRDAGFTVALSGAGGDELFGGYQTFKTLPGYRRWGRWVPFAGAQAALCRVAIGMARRRDPDFDLLPRWPKVPDMVARQTDLVRQYQAAYALFVSHFHEALVGRSAAALTIDGLPTTLYAQLTEAVAGAPSLQAVSLLEQSVFLRSRLLRDADMASMSASLEQRVPLVDSTLSSLVAAMDTRQRFLPIGQKPPLRRFGLVGLDPALFDRPKRGFVLPWERWIRNAIGGQIDMTLRSRSTVEAAGLCPDAVERLWETYQRRSGRVYWSRVWAAYAHVRWTEMNAVGV